MFFTSTHDLADHVARNHFSFNGHRCRIGASVRVFDTIMRCADYLRKEPAAVSCSFGAIANIDSNPVNTIITISISGSGIICEERFGEDMPDNTRRTRK